MQIKTPMSSTAHPPRWLKIKGMTIANADKDVQQQEPSHSIGGSENGSTICKKVWWLFIKQTCTHSTTQQSTLRYSTHETLEPMATERPAEECSQQLYLQQPQAENSPDDLCRRMDRQTGTFIQFKQGAKNSKHTDPICKGFSGKGEISNTKGCFVCLPFRGGEPCGHVITNTIQP